MSNVKSICQISNLNTVGEKILNSKSEILNEILNPNVPNSKSHPLLKSSPSLWEGEEKGGGGKF